MANEEKKLSAKKVTGKETFGRRRIICGIVLIVAAIVIGIILVPHLSTTTKNYSIYIIAQDVPEGTLITQENFSKYFNAYSTTDAQIALAGLNREADAYGSYAKFDLHHQNYLKKSDLTNVKVLSSDAVPEGKELVGVKVTAINEFVGFMPKAGDIVRFYGAETKKDGTIRCNSDGRLATNATDIEAFPYELLSYVEVYSVLDGNGISTAVSGANPTNFVVILEEAQVEQLIEVEKGTGAYLSLVSSGDPVEAKRLLKEQEKITAEHNLLEDLTEEIEMETYSLALSLFELPEELPMIGDVLRIYYIDTVECQEIGEDKEIKTVEKHQVRYPDILSLLQIVDIYDENGASIKLADGNDPYALRYPEVFEGYHFGLSMSEDQFRELADLLKEHELYVEVVLAEEITDESIENQNAAIRLARIEHYLADQAAAEQAELEEEARLAAEELAEKQKADKAREDAQKADKK